MNAMGNIKVLTKTGINMKVFWASIEYKYNGNPMKGGFVYVFVKANSETDAYERITSEFQNLKLSISVIEFLTQYHCCPVKVPDDYYKV